MNERKMMAGKPVFEIKRNTVFNWKSGFVHKKLCTGPTFTAGDACVYACQFCYVDAMQAKERKRFEAQGVVYPPEGHAGVVIRTRDAAAVAREQLLAKPDEFRRSKQVVYASPKVDVAGNMELVRETVEICKEILCHTDWDIRLLSKSNLLPKVAQALEDWHDKEVTERVAAGNPNWPDKTPKQRVLYGVSTGTLDDKLAAAFEAGTPLVSKRIASLHWLQDNGYRTYAMVCPSLPQAAEYPKFASDMAVALRYDRCEEVFAEVINVRGESFTKTMAALVAGGHEAEAVGLGIVSSDKREWEAYAMETFNAHKAVVPPGKLRFLQYCTKDTYGWWKAREAAGAVLLGWQPKEDKNQKELI